MTCLLSISTLFNVSSKRARGDTKTPVQYVILCEVYSLQEEGARDSWISPVECGSELLGFLGVEILYINAVTYVTTIRVITKFELPFEVSFSKFWFDIDVIHQIKPRTIYLKMKVLKSTLSDYFNYLSSNLHLVALSNVTGENKTHAGLCIWMNVWILELVHKQKLAGGFVKTIIPPDAFLFIKIRPWNNPLHLM